mmetsp:Transcript_5368/g.11877  ORF Transcript_5368/g.11877 Transcript_5368/m.11877 type:complete len:281 (-) Transcript_5368:697-1539(-)
MEGQIEGGVEFEMCFDGALGFHGILFVFFSFFFFFFFFELLVLSRRTSHLCHTRRGPAPRRRHLLRRQRRADHTDLRSSHGRRRRMGRGFHIVVAGRRRLDLELSILRRRCQRRRGRTTMGQFLDRRRGHSTLYALSSIPRSRKRRPRRRFRIRLGRRRKHRQMDLGPRPSRLLRNQLLRRLRSRRGRRGRPFRVRAFRHHDLHRHRRTLRRSRVLRRSLFRLRPPRRIRIRRRRRSPSRAHRPLRGVVGGEVRGVGTGEARLAMDLGREQTGVEKRSAR